MDTAILPEGKPVSYSRMLTRHRPHAGEANALGTMHGGMILFYLDMNCGMTAMRHTGTNVVTVAVDRMDFKSPVHIGENVIYKTSVNMAHRSSLEVGARIEAEDPCTGEVRHMGTAYLTFVALNENGRPTRVRPLIPESDGDLRRMADAVRRRNLRRMERWQADGKAFSFDIDLLPEPFLLCRLSPSCPGPHIPAGTFSAIASDGKGFSLVMPQRLLETSETWLENLCALPDTRMEKGWRAFTLRANLDITISGVVANISAILAAEKISIQYVSTFSSGYFLVRGDQTVATTEALNQAGHRVHGLEV